MDGVPRRPAVGWADVVAREPVLAEYVRSRLGGICYFGTVRPDGRPRVHPVGVNFLDGRALLATRPQSPKVGDLRENGRYAVHCTVEDNQGGGGEVLVTGAAVEAEAPEQFTSRGWIAFELLVEEILTVRPGDDGVLAVGRWRPA